MQSCLIVMITVTQNQSLRVNSARDWLVCNHISLKYSKALEAEGNNRANEQN